MGQCVYKVEGTKTPRPKDKKNMVKPFRLKNINQETLLYLLTSNKIGRDKSKIKTEVVSTNRKPFQQKTYDVEVSVKEGNVYHFANLVNKALRSDESGELIF